MKTLIINYIIATILSYFMVRRFIIQEGENYRIGAEDIIFVVVPFVNFITAIVLGLTLFIKFVTYKKIKQDFGKKFFRIK